MHHFFRDAQQADDAAMACHRFNRLLATSRDCCLHVCSLQKRAALQYMPAIALSSCRHSQPREYE